MQRYKGKMLLFTVVMSLLCGCSSTTNEVSLARQPLTDKERTEQIAKLQDDTKKYSYNRDSNDVLYMEDGIVVNADHTLEVEAWKLKDLARSYEEQNSLDYVLASEELEKKDTEWMASEITTKDFKCQVHLYGDDESITLDMQLEDDYVGKYLIAPQSTIINGIVKNKTLFRMTEIETGHFLIKASMKDFEELDIFGLTMENISSLAWYLSAINTETKEMNSFLLATSFPDDYSWEGLAVSDSFSAASGIVMWVMRKDSYSYLCTFNGSNKKIESDLTVTAKEGDMISDSFHLDVSSGEFTYFQIGFNAVGVTVKAKDTVLLQE